MAFFGNKRNDFSIRPPRQQVDGTPFFVTDSANIDFTLENLNLTANLTATGILAGTYGSSTTVPVITLDVYGRVTGITTAAIPQLLLQTNSVDNPIQTILNLIEGTNMTITDDGLGNITFDATGGSGGTYTADNGLTESPANNFQLGGATLGSGNLIRDTYITNDGYTFRIDQTGAATNALYLSHLGTGLNVGTGLRVEVADGRSIRATSTGGIAFEGVTQLDYTAELIRNAASTNNIEGIIRLNRSSTGVPGGGIGGSIDFWIEERQTIPAPIPTDPTVRLAGLWENPGPAVLSRLSRFDIYGYSNGGALLNASVRGDGKFVLHQYGVNTFAGTPTYSLGVDASGNVVEFTGGGGGSGTVTNVSATVPNPTNPAFSVNVPNPTTTPSIDITANGIVSQYIRGDGSLANFPSSTGGGSSVSYYLNGSVNQGTFGGSTYYEMSRTPVLGGGTTFTRLNSAGNGLIAQFITDAGDPNLLSIPGGNWNLELFFRATSSGGSPSYYVELLKYDTIGLAFTLIATDVLTPEGITNGTVLDAYFTALAVPTTPLALTDRIALRVFVNTSGRTIELHTENGHLCQIITTFTTGITALNGLTDQIQNFATPGTTGTAPNWNSVSPNHTLNIPLASTASVTAGLISKSEFDLFSVGSFGVTFDGGGALITSGKIAYVRVPYKGTITGWQLVADQSGSCSIEVKQGVFSPFPPTTTIFTAALSGTQTSSATGLSLAVTAGDWFSFTITGTSAVQLVNLSISITKII